MAQKPKTYWQKRFELLEQRSNLRSQSHISGLAKQYRNAIKETEKDLLVFYNRLAANNDVPSIAAAKKLLDKNELADFKMSLETYTRLAKENGITGDWTKMLENASLKYRISRLEAMKIQMEHHATLLMRGELTGLEQFTAEAYESAYYGSAFEIAKGTGVGKTLFQLDEKRINTVIHRPWAADGKNFSERVWGQHRPQLVQNLHRDLTRSLMRGEGPDKAIKAMAHDFDVSLSAAARLAQTEEAYFSSVAQRDVFSDLDVEQYEIIATLDSHTSDICQDLDGKVFKMSEFEAGVTAPPFHVRCRTTTAPYFDDEVDATRAARDPETGKTVQVPADMKYQDWKDQYTIDPETGKTNAQLKAEQKARAEAERKAQEEAAARAKAEADKQAFVPAKTMKEATEWTAANRGVNVKWGKIGLESVNVINEEMDSLARDIPILKEKYQTVGANGRMKAIAWANSELVEFNPKLITREEIEKQLDNATSRRERIQKSISHYQEHSKLYGEKFAQKSIRTLQEDLKYEVFTVDLRFGSAEKYLRGVVTHETGHTILFRKAKQQQLAAGKVIKTHFVKGNYETFKITLEETDAYKLVDKTMRQARKNGDIYKISKYANSELHEFFAETFTMYRFEKSKLPNYIVEMVEEVIK